MKFRLVDRIERLEPGKRIVTTKALSLAEEYLADHFPAFPVLPGVLMLEAMVQAAAWLVRVEQNFSKSMILLGRARNVRYASFVAPGDLLRCELQAVQIGEETASLKGVGSVGERQTVSGKLDLKCFNLAEHKARLAATDEELVTELRQQFKLIGGEQILAAAGDNV
jgi:3-hydroxyacyl-[acyl-carrier-protein] dehydratase